MKGDPRKRNAMARRLRAMAAQIPNQAVFAGFLAATPEALRAQVRRELIPYLLFRLDEETSASASRRG